MAGDPWPTLNITFRTVAIPASSTATLVAPASDRRRLLAVRNIGVNRATLSHDSAVAPDVGWPLAAADVAGGTGGGFSWSSKAEGAPSNALYVVSAAGTTIAVMEG